MKPFLLTIVTIVFKDDKTNIIKTNLNTKDKNIFQNVLYFQIHVLYVCRCRSLLCLQEADINDNNKLTPECILFLNLVSTIKILMNICFYKFSIQKV